MGAFFNSFDGQIDLLDDLDDHYTARHHKNERRELILRLQELSRKFSIRITILGGDVHLAAVGRFYSNPDDSSEPEHDPRYMANIISSAITNKPPPRAVANLLARRNKIHHLRDGNTDETLLKLFNKQPGGKLKGAEWNMCTMPSRNYAIITEVPGDELAGMNTIVNGGNGTSGHVRETGYQGKSRPKIKGRDGHSPLGPGEEGIGTIHRRRMDLVIQGTSRVGWMCVSESRSTTGVEMGRLKAMD